MLFNVLLVVKAGFSPGPLKTGAFIFSAASLALVTFSTGL